LEGEIAVRFKAHQWVLLTLVLLLPAFRVLAQGKPEATAQLFKRYEGRGHAFRIGEDILTLSLSINSHDRKIVAVRVCSKEPIPFALATGAAEPFRIAELLEGGYAYSPEQVLFLRSEDCLSAKEPSRPATEIWAIPEGASFPSHVEALKSNEARLVSLGKRPANRGVRDYRSAVDQLIKNLRANPTSRGLIFGYFLERPSPVLQRRLREVTKILEQSGLPSDRYLVRPMGWNDEVSTHPPDPEPRYPSVFVIEGMRDSARRQTSLSGLRVLAKRAETTSKIFSCCRRRISGTALAVSKVAR
jgi:hypothetical protein